jgi:arylsulfatase A-like enzyme
MASDRPNVVLIVPDDQGYGDLSCHGNPALETPALDALHDESARLEDFHVSPTCSPTRAALMTGRYDNRVGVWHTVMGRSLLAREETTMAEVFRESGYRTGIFGKWHLGDNAPYRPRDRGFEETVIHGGGGVAQTPDYWGNDYFDDTYEHNGEHKPVDGYCTDVWFDHAIDFVESHADEPFFCYLPTNAAHNPRQVPEEYWQPYAEDLPESLARFYGMIANIDDNVARLRERLADLDIADDTIVCFLGDNGTAGEGFNAGMRGRKGSQYDGGHRVQCFLHWPGRIEDRTVETLSSGIDLLPTLIDCCDLEAPTVEFDGQSLRPLLDREADGDDSGALGDRTLVVDSQRLEWPEQWRQSAVMTDRWRLIDGAELYDMREDPGQETDVAEDNPAIVERLREAYEEWWDDIGPFEDYVRIPVGRHAGEGVELTCMDWHEADHSPWHQGHILEADVANGFWALEIADPGTYEIALRRWPPESDTAIDALPTDFDEMDYGESGGGWTATATAIDPDTARIRIADRKREKPVPSGTPSVSFEVDLESGPCELQTWFEGRESRGAYYAIVCRK